MPFSEQDCIDRAWARICAKEKHAVADWNQIVDEARRRVHGASADAREARIAALNKVRLSGLDLAGIDLRGIMINDAVFETVCFRSASFANSELMTCSFARCDFRWSTFHWGYINGCRFEHCDFRCAELSSSASGGMIGGPTEDGVFVFDSCTFGNTHLGETTIRMATFVEPVIDGACQIAAGVVPGYSGFRGARMPPPGGAADVPEELLTAFGLTPYDLALRKLRREELTRSQANDLWQEAFDSRFDDPLSRTRVFISYTHQDREFASKLEQRLRADKFPAWIDYNDMVAGPIAEQIDAQISIRDAVVVVLSQHYEMSTWIQHEIQLAMQHGLRRGRHMLCPVALDDSWRERSGPEWSHLRKYNILDFSAQSDVVFDDQFRKLKEGLRTYYAGQDGKTGAAEGSA